MEQGFTQIIVSHNLSLAAHYATHVICLNKKVCAEGAPHEALNASILMQLFGVPIHLYPDQCDSADPACPQCGAVCAPERLLPAYASIQRRGGVKAASEGLLTQKGGPDGHAGKGTGTGTGDGSAAGEAGHA